MSSPLIWFATPLLFAIIFWFFQRYRRGVFLWGAALTGFLAVFARFLPVDQPIHLLSQTLYVADTWEILGRKLTLSPGDMPYVSFVFLITTLWFIGALATKATSWFVPLGLGMVAFLNAALGVDPFLYAALFIEVAVLLSIPIMAPLGARVGYGIQRYLISQTLAMPFILYSGWMLTGVENNPADAVLSSRVITMLGLGFAFLLAIFPFYTWIPALFEEASPYLAGFVFVMLPMTVIMFLLNFLDRYAWLRTDPRIFDLIRLAGVLTVATAGIFAAFQNHLGRMLGYAVIIQTGLSLLAISSATLSGLVLLAAQLLTRVVGVWLWAVALEQLKRKPASMQLENLRGLLHRSPFISISILIGLFSLAGLPLLAGFPVTFSFLRLLAQSGAGGGLASSAYQPLSIFDRPPIDAIWTAVGLLGMFVAGMRVLLVMADPRESQGWSIDENLGIRALLGLGILAVFLVGLLPIWFLPGMQAILQGFAHLLS